MSIRGSTYFSVPRTLGRKEKRAEKVFSRCQLFNEAGKEKREREGREGGRPMQWEWHTWERVATRCSFSWKIIWRNTGNVNYTIQNRKLLDSRVAAAFSRRKRPPSGNSAYTSLKDGKSGSERERRWETFYATTTSSPPSFLHFPPPPSWLLIGVKWIVKERMRKKEKKRKKKVGHRWGSGEEGRRITRKYRPCQNSVLVCRIVISIQISNTWGYFSTLFRFLNLVVWVGLAQEQCSNTAPWPK